MTKEVAMETGVAWLEGEGWNFSTPKSVRDELQVTARLGSNMIYLATYDGGARVRYEEFHVDPQGEGRD